MDIAAFIPAWLDALLIAPFRWPGAAEAGFWLGSAFLAGYATIVGELSSAGLFLLHHRYYLSMQDNVLRYHNLSVDALRSGNKEAYIGANKMAQEDFGKSFFAQATVGMSSLWPLPFALGWMALRFEGIDMYTVPLIGARAGYVFVFLSLYIALRLTFSLTLKKRIPLFRRIEDIKIRARQARGKAKSFFGPPPA